MSWAVAVGILLAVLGWHYVGYPLLLGAIVVADGDSITPDALSEWPPVSVIVIAHNEADVIEDRIENIFSVNYPREKLEVVIASDASTDETVERAKNAAPNTLVVDNREQNKSVTRNLGVEHASHDILLFTDADTRYRPDCVKQIVAHYADPEVGGVCGRLVSESFEDGAIGEGMGLYWKWEYYLRRMQGRLGMLVKYSGANMSMRRSFYRAVPDDVDIDQMAGLDVIGGGGRSIFEPEAVATERFPTSLEGELSTRRRLTIRALTALGHHRNALNPFANPLLAVHVWSYWLLRYVVPILLISITVSTAFVALQSGVFAIFLVVQLAGYGLGVIGLLLELHNLEFPFVSIFFSYLWANLGVLIGLVAFLSGERVYAYSDQHESQTNSSGK